MYSNNQINTLFQLIDNLQQQPSEALQAVICECGNSKLLQDFIQEEEARAEALQGVIREVEVLQSRRQMVKLGIHEHRHGESLYLYLVPTNHDFGKADFEELLQGEYDAEFEFLRVERLDEPFVVT